MNLTSPSMPKGLDKLPPEILAQIVSHFDASRTLLCFSLTCCRLHNFVQCDGYRIFVQHNFPDLDDGKPFWKDAAHVHATLSRCWERRSLLATLLPDRSEVIHLPLRTDHDQSRQNGLTSNVHQSMGFQPQLDCMQEWTGTSWGSRKEILAIGAGPELQIRVSEMGSEIDQAYGEASEGDRDSKYDMFHHRTHEIIWKDPGYRQGRDDIMSVHLLRNGQVTDTATQTAQSAYNLVVGRASGVLEKVYLSRNSVITSKYHTGSRSLRGSDLMQSGSFLLAACLDENIALYNSDEPMDGGKPISDISLSTTADSSRIWTTRFLNSTRLAIGRGPSRVPLTVHEVTPSGIHSVPLQTYNNSKPPSSCYALAPLPSSPHLFLSGWFSGKTSLHDMRCPDALANAAGHFTDPWDPDSPVYSLLTRGSTRFIAGGARHALLKFFDIRVPGKRYYSVGSDMNIDGQSSLGSSFPAHSCSIPSSSHGLNSSGSFNIYIRHRNPAVHLRHPLVRSVRSIDSAVYSLASASASSPNFYVGLERQVLQFGFVDPTDRWPAMEYKHVHEARARLWTWWRTSRDDPSRVPRMELRLMKQAESMAAVVLGLAEYERGTQLRLRTLDEVGEALTEAPDSRVGGTSCAGEGKYRLDPRWKQVEELTYGEENMRGRATWGRGRARRGRGLSWTSHTAARGNRFA